MPIFTPPLIKLILSKIRKLQQKNQIDNHHSQFHISTARKVCKGVLSRRSCSLLKRLVNFDSATRSFDSAAMDFLRFKLTIQFKKMEREFWLAPAFGGQNLQ
ncbi:uncharacterized protein LOC131012667 [Salvia miltiorrhiza]|uniref:uncharacterized protein LOC131012667 n=1 Tax=Salvia miltiorrhiza TaxID=226208 RepID=UPI0025ABB30F|nr:uncharacterized protein LOC131012667 [Salvia miltiorrhiza]